MSDQALAVEDCMSKGPQSVLEIRIVDEYLRSKGYSRADLARLPQEQAQQLMREACMYASLKLAELEAKSQFREEIRSP